MIFGFTRLIGRRASAAAVSGLTLILAGCSHDLASIDDVYVPVSADENFPIQVVDKPVRLALDVPPGGLRPSDVGEIRGFARETASPAASPVTVSYPAASARARHAASQAAAVLVQEGVPRANIKVTSYDGKSDVVTLAFSQRAAVTKPCGDWSENLRPTQFNDDVGSNFGCAVRQNYAAMVSDPEDFVRQRTPSPTRSAPQNPAIQTYESGGWTTPNTSTNISSD